ncbi:hypothetical protein PLESTB_001081600 [Pleodorina starrii]|uniref:J domain-containing protein n=1 Tax=Pleodorina starrii TaxID=330485 RepID=A0A9W6BQ36_9CHLO|nr:hypothetical protein PLESTM_001177400 [Pleodorina starrii]GLC56224.1 hypothetical protein PLESTB_001081600 [Pleodorina starrii]GLC69142.1 hypothetical protein PLESTF_000794500 [Pleodorina starrii]
MDPRPHRRGWPATASHYDVLGLPFGAGHEEVKRAYREAARRWHPDKGGTAAAFARVQAAWEVLGDPRRRAAYDTCSYDYLRQYVHQDRQRSCGGEGALLAELQARCAAAAAAAAATGGGGGIGHGLGGGAVVASCQLVVTCELCGRPATRDCSVCGMPFCSFCARRQHWRGSHPLHWPLVVAPGSMLERLGRREMEAKRLEDDRRLASSDPHHRSEAQLRELRAFNEAAALAASRHDHLVRYDAALGRLYMWTQTGRHVLLACYLPNGRHDRELRAEVRGGVLRLGPAGGLPVVQRTLAGALDPAAPVEVQRTADGLFALVVLTKAPQHEAPGLGTPQSPPAASEPRVAPTAWPLRTGGSSAGADGGTWWRQVFAGDSDGARSLPPPYVLTQLPDEVVLELSLPWWVQSEDVAVEVGARRLAVAVRGVGLQLERHYWWNSAEAARRPAYQAVVPELSSWSLADEGSTAARELPPKAAPVAAAATAAAAAAAVAPSRHADVSAPAPGVPPSAAAPGRRRAGRCLTITLARPEPTEEERLYKKGVRQDNRVASRGEFYGPTRGLQAGGAGAGVRFFVEDEDSFGLEPLLQAAMFQLRGGAWVVPPPWRHDEQLACRWVDAEADLPPAARAHLATLRAAAVASASGELPAPPASP